MGEGCNESHPAGLPYSIDRIYPSYQLPSIRTLQVLLLLEVVDVKSSSDERTHLGNFKRAMRSGSTFLKLSIETKSSTSFVHQDVTSDLSVIVNTGFRVVLDFLPNECISIFVNVWIGHLIDPPNRSTNRC